MKAKLAALLLFTAASTCGLADEYVRPYITKDGRYVDGHFRSSPNSTTLDNYSTRGNTNPYTGEKGTKDADDYAPSYSEPRSKRKRDDYNFDNSNDAYNYSTKRRRY